MHAGNDAPAAAKAARTPPANEESIVDPAHFDTDAMINDMAELLGGATAENMRGARVVAIIAKLDESERDELEGYIDGLVEKNKRLMKKRKRSNT